MTKSLDLGCGLNPQNPFKANKLYGLDAIREANIGGDIVEIIKVDLTISPIPYPSDFFDYLTAFDFIEHIPRLLYIDSVARLPFVELMNEIYRVLKDGGIFYSLTPAYPSPKAFQDPTHVNIITEDTFNMYFCGTHPWSHAYGFNGQFEMMSQQWQDQSHLSCHMKKLSIHTKLQIL